MKLGKENLKVISNSLAFPALPPSPYILYFSSNESF